MCLPTDYQTSCRPAVRILQEQGNHLKGVHKNPIPGKYTNMSKSWVEEEAEPPSLLFTVCLHPCPLCQDLLWMLPVYLLSILFSDTLIFSLMLQLTVPMSPLWQNKGWSYLIFTHRQIFGDSQWGKGISGGSFPFNVHGSFIHESGRADMDIVTKTTSVVVYPLQNCFRVFQSSVVLCVSMSFCCTALWAACVWTALYKGSLLLLLVSVLLIDPGSAKRNLLLRQVSLC